MIAVTLGLNQKATREGRTKEGQREMHMSQAHVRCDGRLRLQAGTQFSGPTNAPLAFGQAMGATLTSPDSLFILPEPLVFRVRATLRHRGG